MIQYNVDFEQSLFSSKISQEERKTSKRASVTVSVTCERRCHELLVARASELLAARVWIYLTVFKMVHVLNVF